VRDKQTPASAKPSSAAPATKAAQLSLRQHIFDGDLGGYVLIAPAIILLALLTVWPLIFSVGISLTNYNGLGKERAALEFVGLDNYALALTDPFFLGSVVTTFKIAIVALPLQIILGYVCARILQASQGMFASHLLRTVFIVPTMMSSLTIALFFRYALNPTVGVANAILRALGLPTLLFFADTTQAPLTITAVYLWQWVPFTALLLLAGLLDIPRHIYEAAGLDGARWYQRIRYIDVPLLRRVLVIALILATVEMIRLFDLVYGTTGGGPGTSTYTVSLGIYRTGFQDFNTAVAAASSLMVLVVTIFIAMRFVRLMREEGP
jgi:multiple sugar transport system permease protein